MENEQEIQQVISGINKELKRMHLLSDNERIESTVKICSRLLGSKNVSSEIKREITDMLFKSISTYIRPTALLHDVNDDKKGRIIAQLLKLLIDNDMISEEQRKSVGETIFSKLEKEFRKVHTYLVHSSTKRKDKLFAEFFELLTQKTQRMIAEIMIKESRN
jgi:hypothetical protein